MATACADSPSDVAANHLDLGELYAATNKYLLRVATRILRDGTTAEDVVQRAWAKMISTSRPFEGRSAFRTWAAVVVRNESLAFLRSRGRRSDVSVAKIFDDDEENKESNVIPDALRVPGQQLDNMIRRERVEKATRLVASLSAPYREVARAVYEEGMTVAAAADKLGITLPCAKARLFRATLTMRKRVAESVI